MSLDIRIEEHPPMHGLEIEAQVPMLKIAKVLSDAFPRLDRHIAEKGGERTGAPYVRYLEIDWEMMRHCGPLKMMWRVFTYQQPMRIGMAVAAPVEGAGDIESVTVEARQCVRTIHKGPYQKLGDTYNQIIDWAEANNVELADHTMENYINDPTTVAKENIETLIFVPVVNASGPD